MAIRGYFNTGNSNLQLNIDFLSTLFDVTAVDGLMKEVVQYIIYCKLGHGNTIERLLTWSRMATAVPRNGSYGTVSVVSWIFFT